MHACPDCGMTCGCEPGDAEGIAECQHCDWSTDFFGGEDEDDEDSDDSGDDDDNDDVEDDDGG